MPSTFPEYESFDGLGLANLVKQGVISPQELLNAAIERIEERNPQLNAVIYKMYDEASSFIQQSLSNGIFQGVPTLLKDLLAEYAGTPLRLGSRYTQGLISAADSEFVQRMKAAGLVIVGKTNTPELGLSPLTEPEAFGPTHNPWDLARSSGGSSGGSAAAVGSGMVPLAHASDGGGSIRIPSAYCGVFGFKPSRGRTPTGPIFMRVWQGMVVEHVITRSVRDSAAMLDVVSGPEIGSLISLPKPDFSFLKSLDERLPKLKIALIEQPFFSSQVDPEYISALEKAGLLCRDLGHDVEKATLKIDSEAVAQAFLMIIAGETSADLRLLQQFLRRKPKHKDLEKQTAVVLEAGKHLSAADYVWATLILDEATKKVALFFENYDVIMTPTMARPAPKIGEFKPDQKEMMLLELLRWIPHRRLILKFIERAGMRNFDFSPFTPLFNMTGNPAMSVPLYHDQEGMPIGIQFAGRLGCETTLFQLAAQLEQAQPWHGVFSGKRARKHVSISEV